MDLLAGLSIKITLMNAVTPVFVISVVSESLTTIRVVERLFLTLPSHIVLYQKHLSLYISLMSFRI